jgi:hypothetical protein
MELEYFLASRGTHLVSQGGLCPLHLSEFFMQPKNDQTNYISANILPEIG